MSLRTINKTNYYSIENAIIINYSGLDNKLVRGSTVTCEEVP